MFYACPKDEGHRFISCVNKTNQDIYCQASFVEKTVIISEDSLIDCRKAGFIIEFNSTFLWAAGLRGGLEYSLSDKYDLLFVLFDSLTFKNYLSQSEIHCDSMRKYAPILHHYRLTLEDLQRMNWTVIYPPEE